MSLRGLAFGWEGLSVTVRHINLGGPKPRLQPSWEHGFSCKNDDALARDKRKRSLEVLSRVRPLFNDWLATRDSYDWFEE